VGVVTRKSETCITKSGLATAQFRFAEPSAPDAAYGGASPCPSFVAPQHLRRPTLEDKMRIEPDLSEE
jgi:hypothetical protein